MEWECIKSCQWGATPKSRKFYVVGDVITSEKQPNKHFRAVGKAKVIVNTKLTKAEINTTYGLNLSKSDLKDIKKAELIALAEG